MNLSVPNVIKLFHFIVHGYAIKYIVCDAYHQPEVNFFFSMGFRCIYRDAGIEPDSIPASRYFHD